MKYIPFVFSSFGAFIVAALGGFLTQIDDWYFSLIQPSWKPPDWAFGPIWTTILVLCAISAGICYRNAIGDAFYKKKLIFLFVLNAMLNLIWSLFYFYLQRPDIALFEVVFLWGSILMLILHARKYSKIAAAMLLPYLIWVGIAATLNFQTVILNGPFPK